MITHSSDNVKHYFYLPFLSAGEKLLTTSDNYAILLTMKRTKDLIIYARVDKTLGERLQRIAVKQDVPASQIIRAAVKAELDRIEGKAK